jgi:hypothetical protein
MKTIACTILLFAAVSAVAAPLTNAGHLLAVEAKVNGKGPYHFTIDTGAGGPIRINAELARALGLEQIGETRAGDPSGRNAETRPLYRVDSLDIAGQHFGPMDATTAPNMGGPVQMDGVIGLAAFGGMTVTLDYLNKELRLSRDPLPEKGDHVVPYTIQHGIPVIAVDVAGTPIQVDVDTGSPAVLAIPSAWVPKFQLGEQRVVGHARTSVNEFDIRAADLKGDLRVAGYSASSPRVDIVDIFPVANLGSRFFRDYSVTFDTTNKRMALSK